MQDPIFIEPIAEHVWNTKYRLFEDGRFQESAIHETWSRVALALSKTESHYRDEWRRSFETALSRFRFLPGGRILAGAGSQRRVTLFNFSSTTSSAPIISGMPSASARPIHVEKFPCRHMAHAISVRLIWRTLSRIHSDRIASSISKASRRQAPLPDYFVEAWDVDPMEQLALQSRVQAYVDQSISKTINFPAQASFDRYRDLYMHAYRLDLKGYTVFRAGTAAGCVLSPSGSACP